MIARHDDIVDAVAPKNRVNRRAMVKQSLIAGGIGYVAPMILGSASPAYAQVSTACGCNLGQPCNVKIDCGAGGVCFCWVNQPHTACFCGEGNPCPAVTCSTQADCVAQGFPTFGCVDTCCSGTRCWPPCGTPTPNLSRGPATGTRN